MFNKFNMTVFALATAMAFGSTTALAKVPAEEAQKLKGELTPMGAEKAGNADGTIPAWTGRTGSCARWSSSRDPRTEDGPHRADAGEVGPGRADGPAGRRSSTARVPRKRPVRVSPGASALTAMLDVAHPRKVEVSDWARSALVAPDGDLGFDMRRWKAAASFGVQGSCTPESLGGRGASAVELMLQPGDTDFRAPTSPRVVHTSTVKKSVAAMTSACDFKKVRHDIGRSGAGRMPLSFSVFAMVDRATR